MKQRIQEAIERDALKLRYRPRVDLEMRLVGADVDVLWDAPGDDNDARYDVAVGAAGFLAMTRWAIVRAGGEIGRLDVPRIGFRLSSSVMSEPGLADDLAAATRDGALAPQRIELLLSRSDGEAMQRLSRAGFNLAADAVGGDGPSLVELVEHPFGAMWIPRELVDGLRTNFGCAVLVRSLIQLGHSLDLAVGASGVEDERALAYLREMGCDQLQGDLLGPATDVAGIHAVLARRTAPGMYVKYLM